MNGCERRWCSSRSRRTWQTGLFRMHNKAQLRQTTHPVLVCYSNVDWKKGELFAWKVVSAESRQKEITNDFHVSHLRGNCSERKTFGSFAILSLNKVNLYEDKSPQRKTKVLNGGPNWSKLSSQRNGPLFAPFCTILLLLWKQQNPNRNIGHLKGHSTIFFF